MGRADGRRALVSGASGAVGAAIVGRLVEQGAMVIAVDESEEAVTQAIESLELDDPDSVVTRGLDVSDLGAWWDLANFTEAFFGALDLLVVVSHCGDVKPVRELGIHELRAAQATRVEPFAMAFNRLQKALIESAKETSEGATVVAIPLPPERGDVGALPHAATRASVVAMMQVIARELEAEGLAIRAHALQTSAVDPADWPRRVASAVLALLEEQAHARNGQEWILDASTDS